MSKMTVIQLLNKIANGEDVPKKFTYKGYFWEYDKRNEMWFTYFTRCGEMKNHRFDRLFYLNKCLNEEVEIIEEPKKIEKIEMCTGGIMSFDSVENITTELKDKINELIDEINDLKEKKK